MCLNTVGLLYYNLYIAQPMSTDFWGIDVVLEGRYCCSDARTTWFTVDVWNIHTARQMDRKGGGGSRKGEGGTTPFQASRLLSLMITSLLRESLLLHFIIPTPYFDVNQCPLHLTWLIGACFWCFIIAARSVFLHAQFSVQCQEKMVTLFFSPCL